MERDQLRLAYASEIAMDAVLADSFPASDPPSWTFGVGRTQLQPDGTEHQPAVQAVDDGVSDKSLSAGHRLLNGVSALFQGAGVALLFPILIVGLPVALAVRLILELTRWPIVSPNQR